MSRILDALRRASAAGTDGTPARLVVDALPTLQATPATSVSTAPSATTESWQDWLLAAGQPGGCRRVEHLECRPAPHLLCSRESEIAALERFRFLGHRLYQIRQKRSLSTVLVTSAVPKEGKSVVAVNTALVLAQRPARVLLIDADLRQPSLHRLLGVPHQAGLADFLEGRHPLPEVLRYVAGLGFFFLSAGFVKATPTELLQGNCLRALLEAAAAAFDWLILDSPPLNVFADSAHLATQAEGTLLVARSGWTPKEAFQEAVASLDGAFLAGVVLNAHESRPVGYYDRYRTVMDITNTPSTSTRGAAAATTSTNGRK